MTLLVAWAGSQSRKCFAVNPRHEQISGFSSAPFGLFLMSSSREFGVSESHQQGRLKPLLIHMQQGSQRGKWIWWDRLDQLEIRLSLLIDQRYGHLSGAPTLSGTFFKEVSSLYSLRTLVLHEFIAGERWCWIFLSRRSLKSSGGFMLIKDPTTCCLISLPLVIPTLRCHWRVLAASQMGALGPSWRWDHSKAPGISRNTKENFKIL